MSNEVGNVRAVIWAWAYAGLIGSVGAVLLIVLGDWDFSPAGFVAVLITVVIGGIVTWASRPLPSFDDQYEQRARAAGAGALAAARVAPPFAMQVAMPGAAAPAANAAHVMAATATAGTQTRPPMLTGARGGVADDLKVIKGIGPRLEEMLHRLGVYHFDQIAGWHVAEIAWLDDNLEGFKGRVSRDHWVDQARILAAGGNVDDYVVAASTPY